jgi:hypothetical protein
MLRDYLPKIGVLFQRYESDRQFTLGTYVHLSKMKENPMKSAQAWREPEMEKVLLHRKMRGPGRHREIGAARDSSCCAEPRLLEFPAISDGSRERRLEARLAAG